MRYTKNDYKEKFKSSSGQSRSPCASDFKMLILSDLLEDVLETVDGTGLSYIRHKRTPTKSHLTKAATRSRSTTTAQLLTSSMQLNGLTYTLTPSEFDILKFILKAIQEWLPSDGPVLQVSLPTYVSKLSCLISV